MIDLPCDYDRTFAFDPGKTALMCIDMQRDFLDPRGYGGAMGEDLSTIREIVPKARAVLDAARGLGMRVVHTREGHRPDLSDLSDAKQERSTASGAPIGGEGPLGRLLVRGEPGHDFVDEMQPIDDEPIVDKPGFGAFYATDLHPILVARGVTHLLFLGVTTECCVFSTIREAIDRGFYCCTLQDCCGAYEQSLHDNTFAMIAAEGHLFGWISDSERLLAAAGQPA